MKHSPALYGSLALALALTACSHKKELKPDATPTAQATLTPVPDLETDLGSQPRDSHYVVRKGDTLWAISAKNSVMGDAFRWPLLYKQNRDQLEDPDMIDVQQDLKVNKNVSRQQIDQAVKQAEDTPPYVPHDQPRKSLPLDY